MQDSITQLVNLALDFNEINGWITAVIGVILFYGIQDTYQRKDGENANSAITRATSTIFYRNAPNLMTSIGVFGTFLGIVFGLLEFDPDNLENSINTLIVGMKTAFVSSVVGMFGAIVFKGHDVWRQRNITLADETANQVTDALEKLIESFNAGLMEQFGENFRLLDESVKGLNEWLDKYRIEVENTKELLEKTAENNQEILDNTDNLITRFDDTMTVIQEKISETLYSIEQSQTDMKASQMGMANSQEVMLQSQQKMESVQQSVKESMESSDKMIKDLLQTVNDLQQSLSRLSELEFENFQDNMQEMLSAIETASAELQKTPDIVKDALEQSSTQFMEHMDTVSKNMSDKLETASAELQKTPDVVKDALEQSSTQFMGHIDTVSKNMSDKLETATTKTMENLDKQTDTALQKMGNQLATVSETFVNDYRPLTEKLRDVVNIANDINTKKR